MIWGGFTKAHDPTIEGLRHGGAAEHTRHALTAFGSGWRGLVSAPGWLLKTLGRNGAVNSLSMESIAKAGAAVSEVVKSGKLAGVSIAQSELDTYRTLERQLAQMERWSDRTKNAGMIVNRDYMASGGAAAKAELRKGLADRRQWGHTKRPLPRSARQVERGSWFQASKWKGFEDAVKPLTADEMAKIRKISGLPDGAPVNTHPKAARKLIERWEKKQAAASKIFDSRPPSYSDPGSHFYGFSDDFWNTYNKHRDANQAFTMDTVDTTLVGLNGAMLLLILAKAAKKKKRKQSKKGSDAVVRKVMKSGEHRHDRSSKQSVHKEHCSTSMPCGA